MKILKKYISLIVFLVLIIVWQVSCMIFSIPSYLIPSPIEVITTLKTDFGILLIHTSYTLVEALVGIVIAVLLGILVAICLFRYTILEQIFMPYISILQTIPAIVIAPLFAMWFGFGFFPKVLLIVIFCSFPIIVASVSSFKQVDIEKVLYLKTINANTYQLFRHLYIPSAAESIFASVKISTTYALVNAIFAEYMGASTGLGVYLNRASSSFDTAAVFAVIVIIIIVTLSMLKVVSLLEKKIIKWS